MTDDELFAENLRRCETGDDGRWFQQAADRIEALTAELEAERALADQLADDLEAEIGDAPYDYDSLRVHAARRSPKEQP